jgi:hypothetical protein
MGDVWVTTGTAQRNREVGRAIRGAALFSGSALGLPDAWCCVPVACRVQQLLAGVGEFGTPGLSCGDL